MAEFTEFEKVGNLFSSVDVDVEKVGNHLVKDSEIIGEIVGNHIYIDLSAIGGGGGGGRIVELDEFFEEVEVNRYIELGFKPRMLIVYDIPTGDADFTSVCYTNINEHDDIILWTKGGYCRKDIVGGGSYIHSIDDNGVTLHTLSGQSEKTLHIIAIA